MHTMVAFLTGVNTKFCYFPEVVNVDSSFRIENQRKKDKNLLGLRNPKN